MVQTGKMPLQRKSTHYINSILITALALFLLGLMALIFVSFVQEKNRIKEKIKISAFLKDDVGEADVNNLRKKIEANESVKSTEYISKQQAAEIVKQKYGEDISDMLGDYNPLPASVEVYLNAENVNTDSIEAFEKKLNTYSQIKFTKADKELVNSLNSNFKIFGAVIATLSIIFLVIAVAIIDKTIRLSMYANRFIIRSMQLVGATRNFVTAPYVKKGIVNGITSAIFAVGILIVLIVCIQSRYHYWDFKDPQLKIGMLLTALILFAVGILITWWSTRNAVHKYIKMKLDELY